MQVVTIASHEPKEDYYSYQEFLASLKRFDIEPIVLKDGYAGLGCKPLMLHKAILAGMIKDEQMVFVDAFDVIFQRDPRELPILDKLVFGAERNCFPDASLTTRFAKSDHGFCFLNSGFSFGPTRLYLDAINAMPKEDLQPDRQNLDGSWNNPNDQLTWQRMFLGGQMPMQLDVNAEFVLNVYGVENEEVIEREGMIYFVKTSNAPFCFHMNGAKQPWKTFLKQSLKL